MKWLWQAFMETRNSGIRENDIFFDVTDTTSPYGEATLKNVGSPYGSDEKKIAVNPYYSYEDIFDYMIKPGKVPELTKYLCDLILHHLCDTDSLSGMDLEAFYVRFLEEDIKNGALGEGIYPDGFTEEEIRKIAFHYLRLCRTGCYEKCFCGVLQSLYRYAWVNAREDGSLVLIINQPQTPADVKKTMVLKDIFLQAGRICHMYWDIPPGIVGCRDTPLGSFMLFRQDIT